MINIKKKYLKLSLVIVILNLVRTINSNNKALSKINFFFSYCLCLKAIPIIVKNWNITTRCEDLKNSSPQQAYFLLDQWEKKYKENVINSECDVKELKKIANKLAAEKNEQAIISLKEGNKLFFNALILFLIGLFNLANNAQV